MTDAPAAAPRLATAADLPGIRAVVHDAYSPYIARIGRPPGPMLDDYAALVADGRVHVIEHAGCVAGVLVLLPQAGATLLDNVAVAPAARGTGVGRRLLRFAEQAARAAGHDRIVLYTNEAMTENLGLYARIGYTETHRAEEKGHRRVYMAKVLGGDGR